LQTKTHSPRDRRVAVLLAMTVWVFPLAPRTVTLSGLRTNEF
jgi:hypothetical protein